MSKVFYKLKTICFVISLIITGLIFSELYHTNIKINRYNASEEVSNGLTDLLLKNQYAKINLVRAANGLYLLIPLDINSQTHKFLLDIGSAFTTIDQSLINSLEPINIKQNKKWAE
jgi:hypothetical protein